MGTWRYSDKKYTRNPPREGNILRFLASPSKTNVPIHGIFAYAPLENKRSQKAILFAY